MKKVKQSKPFRLFARFASKLHRNVVKSNRRRMVPLTLAGIVIAGTLAGLQTEVSQAAISLRSTTNGSVTNQVQFRAGNAATTGAAATSLALPMPTGTVQNDVMVAALTIRGGTGTTISSVPAGWTLLDVKRNSTTVLTQVMYWKRAGAGEAGPYAWNFTSNKASGSILSYSGVDTTTAIGTSLGQVNASNAQITAPSVSATAGDMLVGFFGTAVGSGSDTITATSMSNLRNQAESTGNSGASRTTTAGADMPLTATGATGTQTATAASAAVNIGQVVTLKPAATPPSSLSLSAPAGMLQNDALIASIVITGNTTITAPSGWTSIQRQVTAGNEIAVQTWWKLAGASEPGSYSWSWTGGVRAAGVVMAYSGVDVTSPIDVSGGQANTSSTTIGAPSVVTTATGGTLVTLFGVANSGPITPSSPLINRASASAQGTSALTAIGAAEQDLGQEGATGGRSATVVTAGVSVGQTVALRPLRAQLTQGSHRWYAQSPFDTSTTLSTTLKTWTTRTSPTSSNLNAIAYGNGIFVAVTSDTAGNRVMTSPDGITWTSRSSVNPDSLWVSVTYGNGLFVAVGSSGFSNAPIMTSPDGITWTSRTIPVVGNFLNSVTYGNGRFVAVGSVGTGNRAITSTDGITWTSGSGTPDNSWASVTYGNDMFVAVSTDGTGNRVMSSPDGTTWTARNSTADNSWRSVAYGNGVFAAVSSDGTDRVMTSPDGITWTPRNASSANTWYSIAYVGTQFYVHASGNQAMVSSDGISWSTSISASSGVVRVAFGNGMLVGVGSNGFIATAPLANAAVPSALGSQDVAITNATNDSVRLRMNVSVGGKTWQAGDRAEAKLALQYAKRVGSVCSASETFFDVGTASWTAVQNVNTTSWESVAYGNGLFVAVAGVGTNLVMTSPDGITWTQRSAASSDGWKSVTYGNGLFVAVANSGAGSRVMTSPDGITWTARTSPASSQWSEVTYGNGLFVAVASNGTDKVMTSTDGITWSTSVSPGNAWQSVVYGNGLFVAVASGGTNPVMTSPDGITWTNTAAATGNAWSSVTYGNGLFVAVATSGTGNRIMTSPDGRYWSSKTNSVDNNWSSVTYGNGLFVAVATSGTGNRIMTSPDGDRWTIRSSPVDRQWNEVAYGYGRFVAVAHSLSGGDQDRVMYMNPPVNWGGNQVLSNGTVTANANDPTQAGTVVRQHYVSQNYFTNHIDTAIGNYGMFDFDLSLSNGIYGDSYCFRLVNSNGSTLAGYSSYPEITRCTVPSLESRLRHGAAFCGGNKRFYWNRSGV